MKRHAENVKNISLHDEHFERFTNFICAAVYGVYGFSESRMRFTRKYHHRNVLEYFDGRPNDLLVMDITAGKGWQKLAPFLGQPIPDDPFPRNNELSKPSEWTARISDIYSSLLEYMVPGSELILVDDGKFGAVFTKDFKVHKFMEENGDSRGWPTCDAAAIKEFERMKHRGLSHIVFARTSFLWLKHYKGFKSHLDQHCKKLFDNENVVVFNILGSPR